MTGRRSRRRAVGRLGRCLLTALVGLACIAAGADDLAHGDAAWARRAEGQRDGRPQSGAILEAVRSYESALRTRPASLEVRWKLLRALHFAGDFASEDEQEKRRIFARGGEVSEQGIALLADQASFGARLEEMDPEGLRSLLEAAGIPTSDVARFYFWSAIHWGAWSRTVGLLGAVRQGVANRLHRYALVAIALEPELEEGGAFRLLGRLHAELPRVPFVSGWVDRDQALPMIERAYAMAPANPGNRLLLAVTLLDLAPLRAREAQDLLQQVEALEPRPSMRIEDLALRREARKRLAAGSFLEPT
jgi:tetratricopeptide (TPR) repeat protein